MTIGVEKLHDSSVGIARLFTSLCGVAWIDWKGSLGKSAFNSHARSVENPTETCFGPLSRALSTAADGCFNHPITMFLCALSMVLRADCS